MATPIVMPRLGDFMTEGVVGSWNKQSGDQVSQGESLTEIESEKLNYDLEAPSSGILHIVANSGETIAVDSVIAYLLEEDEEPPAAPIAEAPLASPATSPGTAKESSLAQAPSKVTVKSTPGARKVAASLGIDISLVLPSGARITEADVRSYADQSDPDGSDTNLPTGLPTPLDSRPLDGMRRGIADHMRSSLSNTAQLSFFIDVDVTDAQRDRREASKESSSTITLAHLLMKACSEAIKRVPTMNSVLSDGVIHSFESVNMGFAVALDDGLIVHVIREIESKSLADIAVEMEGLATQARDGKLLPDQVVGGTFTISVLGVVDGFTPILNAGQSAILGVGRSVEKPVVRKSEIVIREILTLSLTVDHQVIDGAVATTFLRRLQQSIERPGTLFK